MAINRYEGFFKTNPMSQEIHNKVSELYILTNDKVKAGHHLFFKQNPTKEETKCICEFKKAYGNSPTIILKKLIYKENFKVHEMSFQSKLKLKRILEEAEIESKITPNFLKGIKRYFVKN